MQTIDFLPHFAGDLVANHAGVFPRMGDAREDGIGIVGPEGQEFSDGLATRIFIELKEQGVIAGAFYDRHPMFGEALIIQVSEIKQELEIDIHNARNVFRSFDITAHPEQRIGNAREHYFSWGN